MAARIEHIDILKGMGIVLVILGHLSTIPYAHPFIYSVHIPLFFLISGYFFHPEGKDARQFVAKSAKRYLLPYLVTCMIILALYFVTGVHGYSLSQSLLACAWGKSTNNVPFPDAFFASMPAIGAIWFLLALFFADVFFYLSFRMGRWQSAMIVISLIMGIASFRYIYLPFSIQSGMVATIYLYIGYLYRQNERQLADQLSSNKAMVVLLALWCVSVAFGGVDIAICRIKGFVIFGLIGSCCGVYLLAKLSRRLTAITALRTPLAWLGSITLFVLCIHLIDIECLRLNYKATKSLLPMIDAVWIRHIVQTFSVLVIYSIYIPVLWFITRKLPFIKSVYNLK